MATPPRSVPILEKLVQVTHIGHEGVVMFTRITNFSEVTRAINQRPEVLSRFLRMTLRGAQTIMPDGSYSMRGRHTPKVVIGKLYDFVACFVECSTCGAYLTAILVRADDTPQLLCGHCRAERALLFGGNGAYNATLAYIVRLARKHRIALQRDALLAAVVPTPALM